MTSIHSSLLRFPNLLFSLTCLVCWQAHGDPLAGLEKPKKPNAVTYDAAVLRAAFSAVIKELPKDVSMDTFIERIEEKIAPAKLDDQDGDINWGVGDFRLNSKKIPNCKIILACKAVDDPKKQPERRYVILVAEYKEAVPEADGKLAFKTVGNTWDRGKVVADRK